MEVWIYTIWISGCCSLCWSQTEFRGILLLTNDSSRNFNELWSNDSYNDPYNNKSEIGIDLDPATVGGDFKSAIDPAWGTPIEKYAMSVKISGSNTRPHVLWGPIWIQTVHKGHQRSEISAASIERIDLILYNDIGDIIGEFDFNVSGTNITLLSSWVTSTRVVYNWPHSGPTTLNPIIRDGNKEMLMTDPSTGGAMFAIVHEEQWPTALLLAVNSSELMNASAGGDLENIAQPLSVVLLHYYDPGWTDTVVINSTMWDWADDFIYMNGLGVTATDAGDAFVPFNMSYIDDGYTNYTYIYEQQFTSDGEVETLSTLLVEHLQILFDAPVQNITISILGPPASSFVPASMLFVQGLFDTPTTSTSSSTSSTTSTTSSTTSPPTTTTPSNRSIVVNGTLYCPCVQQNVSSNTTQNLTEILDEIVANLTLDKDSLSSNTRRYTSADDSRPSAKAFGAFAVIIIGMAISVVVFMDSATLVKELTKIPKNYKRLKKRLSQRSLRVDDISTQVIENHVSYAENCIGPPPRPGITKSVTLPEISM